MLNSLLKIDEKCSAAKLELATLFSEIGHLQRAVTLLLEVLKVDSTCSHTTDLLVKMAGWYREGGQHDAAKEILLKILSVDRTFKAAKDELLKLSATFCEQGSREKAV